jgi:hypothetical protein
MNIQEAQYRYQQLRQMLAAKQISPKQFESEVKKLRIKGPDGAWWALRSQDGAWFRYDGRSWQPAQPPVQPPAQSGLPLQPATRQAGRMGRVAPGSGTQQAPKNLLQLVGLIVKGLLKGLPWKIVIAGLVFVFTWLVHTFLMVGPNGGYGAGSNAFLDNVLALRGRVISGTLFWTLLTALPLMIGRRLLREGITKTVKDLITLPAWLRRSWHQAAGISLPVLIASMALHLLFASWLNNRLVSLQLILVLVGSLLSQNRSLSQLALKLGYQDFSRLLRRSNPAPYSPAWGAIILAAGVVGLGGGVILPWLPWVGCFGVFVLLGLLVLVILIRQGKPVGGVARLLIFTGLFAALAIAAPVRADDCGWSESQGDLGVWVQSGCVVTAVPLSTIPAAGAGLGTLIGLGIGTLGAIPVDLGEVSDESLTTSVDGVPEPEPEPEPEPGPDALPDTQILDGQSAIDVLVQTGRLHPVQGADGTIRYQPVNMEAGGSVPGVCYTSRTPDGNLGVGDVVIIYQPPAGGTAPQPEPVPADVPETPPESPSEEIPPETQEPEPPTLVEPPKEEPPGPPESPPEEPEPPVEPEKPPEEPEPPVEPDKPEEPPVEPPRPPDQPEEPPIEPDKPTREPLVPPDAPKPPGLELAEGISDAAGRFKDAHDKANEILDELPLDDKLKDKIKERISPFGDKAEKVKGYADTASEYIKVLDENLTETDKLKLQPKAQEGLAWWRVVMKGAGEATEKFVDTVTAPFTKIFGSHEEKAQDIIHQVVPVKEFGDELGKLPTSASKIIRHQRIWEDDPYAQEIYEDLYSF